MASNEEGQADRNANSVGKPRISVAVITRVKAGRDGLLRLLGPAHGIVVACEHWDLNLAIRDLLRLKISAVILCAEEPEHVCADIRKLRFLARDAAIIVLSPRCDAKSILSALASGASGYVAVTSPLDQLARAVEATSKGDVFLGVLALWAVREHISLLEPGPTLTEREREVCICLCSRDEKAVARGLGISAQTVHTHCKAIYKKLRVHGRKALLDRLISSSKPPALHLKGHEQISFPGVAGSL